MIQKLQPNQLRRTIDPTALGVDTSECIEPSTTIIGQERAVRALQFGLGIQQIGYHIFVAGPPGMGKMSAVRNFLGQLARGKQTPSDWCYINNFEDPYQPKVIRLPPGVGRQFQHDVKSLVEQVRRAIPRIFESEEYSARRDAIIKAFEQQREALFQELNEKATQAGFVIQATQMGIAIIPVLSGRPLTDAEFQALPPAAREDFQQRRESIQEQLKAVMKQGRALERQTQEQLAELDRQAAMYAVGEFIDDLIEKYEAQPDITDYFNALRRDIVDNIELFKSGPPQEEGQPPAPAWQRNLPFRKYEVNVVVDHGKLEGAPLVVLLNPTYNNLFGRIEKETHYGALYTDFTMIKAGALHQANGGYLVIPIEGLLSAPLSWDSLKRALRSRQIEIEEPAELIGYITAKSLRPQPIPLDIKVILIGPPLFYYLLHAYDSEFAELFRVKADFDTSMPYTAENARNFLSVVCRLCANEQLNHLDSSAMAKLLEYAARLANDQNKLSTHFGAVADVVREAHYWSQQANSSHITAEHIRRALDEKVYRSNLIQERLQERIAEGTLLIDTTGARVGQVNGLTVINLGDYMFGEPGRITASVGPGHEGIVDIERQVSLSGPIHSKGVLILQGYLRQKYLPDRNLSLSARLVFEQSYEVVDGDSASSTELYAILSALSEYPLKQGIAVTGSVDQHGRVQAIGGVNAKIEGFFDVCKAKGLTGDQGVLIPASNVRDLMLREDVVEAVTAGRFHIWAVDTIDDGITLLTGVPAGERMENGRFPEGTVNARVEQRLRELANAR
ncbi:MAG: ATP-binding protein [Anaerolineae bacterium]|nr:AAA family ATPase [Thermoflexales bacterium]MDW8408776.1 ATP-binding protein [Anaerolineae bacterium]